MLSFHHLDRKLREGLLSLSPLYGGNCERQIKTEYLELNYFNYFVYN